MSDQYLIVLAIEPMPMGGVFAPGVDLPQHCMLMPWFTIEPGKLYSDVLFPVKQYCEGEQLKGWSSGLTEIRLIAGKPDLFGSDHDIPVYCLRENAALTLLHFVVLGLLGTNVTHRYPEWIGAGWNPHVKVTEADTFTKGSEYLPVCLYVIRKDEFGTKYVHDLCFLPSANLAQIRGSHE